MGLQGGGGSPLRVGDREAGRSFLAHHFHFETRAFDSCTGHVLFPTDVYETARDNEVLIPLVNAEAGGEDTREAPVDVLTAFLENFPSAAVLKDADGKFLWCNKAYLKITGFQSVEGLVGWRTRELLKMSDLASIEKHEQRAKLEKTGVLASEFVKEIQRRNLRFPLLDPQLRVTHLAGIGTEPAAFQLDASALDTPEILRVSSSEWQTQDEQLHGR